MEKLKKQKEDTMFRRMTKWEIQEFKAKRELNAKRKKEFQKLSDIISYYADVKESTPSYFYYKRKEKGVMNFLFNQHSGNEGAFGDLCTYFRNPPKYITQDPSKMIKEINKCDFVGHAIIDNDKKQRAKSIEYLS